MSAFDLIAAARTTMRQNGFDPDFSDAVRREVEALPRALPDEGVRDLRSWLWSSIDNVDSRDLDQIEYVEARRNGELCVYVGIADVDARVPVGSAIDARAGENSTSVYTGVEVYPMLPEALSCDLTSLNFEQDRLALVTSYAVREDGSVADGEVFRALVKNRCRLAYEEVAPFLEGGRPSPRISAVPGIAAQLKLQDEAARKLRQLRYQRGALELETIEARAVTKDGEVVALTVPQKIRSRELIEDFMIAANGVIARFLGGRGRSAIARMVKTPRRWDRIRDLARERGAKLPEEPSPRELADFLHAEREKDPERFSDLSVSVVKLLGPGEYALQRAGDDGEGHFGLAAHDYSHSTAPNRRFADLVTQRLVKAALVAGPAPYPDAELEKIAARCTMKDHDARKVERTMRKIAAALLLSSRVGEQFDAICTGVTEKGTFARLLDPPAEGRVIRGEKGLDVGEKVRVKLVSTSPERGFIDFARV
jgi:VacB/RNase II family 3'-5' exoribonuclease